MSGDSSRRRFLKSSLAAGAMAFPSIVPSTVFGRSAPSNLIQVGQIGCGRIARASEFPGILRNADVARFVAVSDLDTVRLADAKQFVEGAYQKKFGSGNYAVVKTYADYRQMLKDKSIDAVCISTPDHWHAQPAMEAALAGKDIYLQKPASLTIAEGREMADVVKQTGRILQVGSQQRSDEHFRLACELVRNGRIGAVKQVFIGLPEDPAGEEEREMPIPSNLNYDEWLGSTPVVYYTENRVHPQSPDILKRYDRPGWLRCEQFGAGMITGWGAHHIDIAHWAMDTEYSGPVEVVADARFPSKGLWDVHGPYHVRAQYANGATVFISEKYANGIKFIGENGWIWVTRGRWDASQVAAGKRSSALDASDPRILTAGIKDNEVHLHVSPKHDHHLDWLTAVRTRKEPSTNAETGHRSCTACLVAHAAMRLGRTVKWNPATERFGDEEANAMLKRKQRAPFGSEYVKRG
ncbi:MAG TPA: Gfo/Idh/MocA family oxidoreductase [Bryobacteraceae bacterium]|nr:Gfo/Idh/MocA family oxidoreductase [Bryobacteraceae bacterium]